MSSTVGPEGCGLGDEECVEKAAGILLDHGGDEFAVVATTEKDVLVVSVKVKDGERERRSMLRGRGCGRLRREVVALWRLAQDDGRWSF